MHARCPISAVFGHYGRLARPPSCRPSRKDPGDSPLMISGTDLCFPAHEIPVPGFIYAGGKHTQTWVPPYIKLVKYSIRVETLLTVISHPILNQPAMEADTCGFFVATDTPTGSESMWPAHFLHTKYINSILGIKSIHSSKLTKRRTCILKSLAHIMEIEEPLTAAESDKILEGAMAPVPTCKIKVTFFF